MKVEFHVHVRWVPLSLSLCHCVSSDCGWRNGLQQQRVVADILNKQQQASDKRWSSNLGVGRGTNNSSP
jgi:hypothetical protein